MKKVLFTLALLLMCGITHLYAQEENKEITTESKSDSVSYDLLIIDTGFESWLLSQRPMHYNTNEYYRLWNNRYVSEWNAKYLAEAAKYPEIENYIQYDSTVDYGIEINYRLYMYFKFFEEKNDITLVRRR